MKKTMPKSIYIGSHNNKKTPFIKFRAFMIIFILLLTLGSCFFIYMLETTINPDDFFENNYGLKTVQRAAEEPDDQNSSSENTATDTSVPAQTSPPKQYSVTNPVPQNTVKSSEYWNSCALVGDFLMADIADTDEIPSKNVLANSDINLSNVTTALINTTSGSDTLLNILAGNNFSSVYILLGNNEIAVMPPEQMISAVKEFLDKVKLALPEADIYLLPIPPVTGERERMLSDGVKNSVIDSYNSQLLRLANEESVFYADINTALKGNNGTLPAPYADSDNITLRETAKAVIRDYILSHTK